MVTTDRPPLWRREGERRVKTGYALLPSESMHQVHWEEFKDKICSSAVRRFKRPLRYQKDGEGGQLSTRKRCSDWISNKQSPTLRQLRAAAIKIAKPLHRV
jgi:hypothetical protein